MYLFLNKHRISNLYLLISKPSSVKIQVCVHVWESGVGGLILYCGPLGHCLSLFQFHSTSCHSCGIVTQILDILIFLFFGSFSLHLGRMPQFLPFISLNLFSKGQRCFIQHPTHTFIPLLQFQFSYLFIYFFSFTLSSYPIISL